MTFKEIELISLKYALDTIGIAYTTQAVESDPSLSIDENFYNSMVVTETIVTEADPDNGIAYSEEVVDAKQPLDYYVGLKLELEASLKEARVQEVLAMFKGRELDVMCTTGIIYTKAQQVFNSYITEDNIEKINELLAKLVEIEEAEAEADLINTGAKLSEVCSKTLNFIAGMNMSKGFTIAQIDQIQALYSETEAALRSGRPDKALASLAATTTDGVLMTEEDKSKVVAFINKKLTE